MPTNKTNNEAIALAQSGWWKDKTPEEIVAFQLYEDKLCMDWGPFHEATETVLGRPVYTHEFAYPETLRAELEGRVPKATLADVLSKIRREHAVILVHVPKED